MIITYHGHSCFKLKGKNGTVVTDPYDSYIGFSLPNLSADLVTISHDHRDHNQADKIKSSNERGRPFIIKEAGEYEVGGISVFGVSCFHDEHQGVERGRNIAFTIIDDGLRVCHLGDLGHVLNQDQLEKIGIIDILIVPVGGGFTINPTQALEVARLVEPSIIIPMHYRTTQHDQKLFGELAALEDFIKESGLEPRVENKLVVERDRLPEEMELVVLEKT